MLGHAAAAIGGKVWMFGGQQGRKFLRSLYCFDTETCTWSRRDSDSHPAARAGHAMVTVHGSVVYMFGGQGKRLYNDLYKLDPATGLFSEVEAAGKPPSPRRGHSLVWDGRDYLVCFGGINAQSTDAQLCVFSLSRGAWFTPQAFGPAPSARTQHSATLLSPGVILIFGGCNSGGTFFNDVFVLDTRTFTWHKPSLLNTAPAPRYHHTCAAVGGRLLIYGGINSKQTFDGVVVVESKFMSDISCVAEELFRMSAEPASASTLLATGGGGGVGTAGHSPLTTLRMGTPVSGPSSGVQPSLSPHAAPQQQQQQQPRMAAAPPSGTGQAPAEHGLASLASFGGKTLDAVKVQLTDLLLRRNLEEQQMQTAKKAETTESLLVKEREAREAAGRELLQLKLMLAEAEAARSAAEQQLATATSRATREAAAAAELRAQLDAMQAKLSAREEELQEARQLQDSLVKELGIMASRYSRLAVDVQEAADRNERERERGRERERERGREGPSSASAASASGAVATADARRASLGGGGSAVVSTAVSAAVSAALRGGSAGGAGGAADVLQALAASHSGSHSQPLPALPSRHADMLSSLPGAAAFSSHCATSSRPTPTDPRSTASATFSTSSTSAGCCCQQLLLLLSECEVGRSSLLEANQGLSEKVEELKARNGVLQGQLRQLQAEAAALEPLSSPELEELERKLDGSARSVREALMQRKIDEAQRRSSSEQAACAVCMEGPKAVVFNCGHQSCGPCAGKMSSCPFCRVAITARIRLFDA